MLDFVQNDENKDTWGAIDLSSPEKIREYERSNTTSGNKGRRVLDGNNEKDVNFQSVPSGTGIASNLYDIKTETVPSTEDVFKDLRGPSAPKGNRNSKNVSGRTKTAEKANIEAKKSKTSTKRQSRPAKAKRLDFRRLCMTFFRNIKAAIKKPFGFRISFKNRTFRITTRERRSVYRFTIADVAQTLIIMGLSFSTGLLFGTARLFDMLAPFAMVICVIAFFFKDLRMKLPTVMGALVGSFASSGSAHTIAIVMALTTYLVFSKKLISKFKIDPQDQGSSWPLAVLVATCLFISITITNFIWGQGVDFVTLGAAEALVAGGICVVVLPTALTTVKKKGISQNPDITEVVAILVVACVICCGLQFFNLNGLTFGTIFAFFATGYIGYVAGAAAGSVGGAAMGLMLSMSGSSQTLIGAYLCIMGLFCGAFRKFNKVYAAMAVLMLGTVSSFDIFNTVSLPVGFGQALIASLAFFLTPAPSKVNIASNVVGVLCDNVPSYVHDDGSKGLFVKRVDEMRGMFEDLARGMNGVDVDRCDATFSDWLKDESFSDENVSSNTGKEDISNLSKSDVRKFNPDETVTSDHAKMASLVSDVCDDVCSYCSKYGSCWEGNFFRTYRDISSAITLGELNAEISSSDLPASLKGRCVKPEKLSEAVNAVNRFRVKGPMRASYRDHQSTKSPFKQGVSGGEISAEALKDILSMELNGLMGMMDSLTTDLKCDMAEEEHLKKGILKRLSKIGFRIDDLVVKKNSAGTVIEVLKPACSGERECANVVLPIVSNQAGKPFMLYNVECSMGYRQDREVVDSYADSLGVASDCRLKCENGCKTCKIRLMPAVKYQVEVDVVEKAKCLDDVNGDSYMVKLLDDGRLAMAISDGMGTGISASRESKAAIKMLAKLLEMGVESEFAVQTVNLMMLMRSKDDSFTTLDLTVVDLFSGTAEVIKAGAPSSVVKRGKEAASVGGYSLPAGVFAPLEIQKIEIELADDDVMVMMSDGVGEGFSSGVDWNKKVNKVLKHLGDVSVSEINRAILNISNGNYKKSGVRKDDMTILTARLKRVQKAEGAMSPVVFDREDVYAQDVVGAVRTAPPFAG